MHLYENSHGSKRHQANRNQGTYDESGKVPKQQWTSSLIHQKIPRIIRRNPRRYWYFQTLVFNQAKIQPLL